MSVVLEPNADVRKKYTYEFCTLNFKAHQEHGVYCIVHLSV